MSLIVAKAPGAALLELESSFCGTNPQALPSSLLASALITFASSLEEGSLRTRIEQEAGQSCGMRLAPLLPRRLLQAGEELARAL